MAVMMLGSAAVVTSCGDDDDEVKTYLLNVNLQLNDGLTLDNISNLKMVVTNSLEQEQTIDLTDVTTTMTVVGGQYDFVVSGKVKDEAAAHATGTASTSVFADTNVTIQVSKSIQGSLVWKTIYTTGAKSGYLKDSYFEIANNSDEVQYLDQVMLFYTSSALTSESAWQQAGYLDRYPMYQGSMVAFPGSGTDYPLQPGQSVTVADQAMNHQLAYGEDESKKEAYSKAPDLSNADFEKFYDNGDVDNTAVPNMVTVLRRSASAQKMWAFGVAGRAYILIKLPQGMTPQQYVADENNFTTYPGSTSSTLYLKIPSKYVLDAVDVYQSTVDPSEHYPFFAAKDDATGVRGGAMYSSQPVRRKVEKIENGRVYYQDTNNSTNDFDVSTDNTPGMTPTVIN